MCEFGEFLAVEPLGREEWALSQAMTTNTLLILGYHSKDWTKFCNLPVIGWSTCKTRKYVRPFVSPASNEFVFFMTFSSSSPFRRYISPGLLSSNFAVLPYLDAIYIYSTAKVLNNSELLSFNLSRRSSDRLGLLSHRVSDEHGTDHAFRI